MWSASIDQPRHLLELNFADRVDATQAKECTNRVRELLAQLEPGFTLLTDLSALSEMDLACGPSIDAIMDEFNQRGIHKVVRVVPDPTKDIGFGIMSLFHYSPSVRVITCESRGEALEHLPR